VNGRVSSSSTVATSRWPILPGPGFTPRHQDAREKGHDRGDLDSSSASVKRSQCPGAAGRAGADANAGGLRRAQSSRVTTNLGSSAPNEANSPVWTAKASAVRPAELPWDEARQTKPISRATNAKRLVARGLRQPTRSLARARQGQFPSRGKEKTPAGAAALRNATLPSGIRKEANQEIGVPKPAAGRRKQLPGSPGVVEW
jgi:hypothetical protein